MRRHKAPQYSLNSPIVFSIACSLEVSSLTEVRKWYSEATRIEIDQQHHNHHHHDYLLLPLLPCDLSNQSHLLFLRIWNSSCFVSFSGHIQLIYECLIPNLFPFVVLHSLAQSQSQSQSQSRRKHVDTSISPPLVSPELAPPVPAIPSLRKGPREYGRDPGVERIPPGE